MAKPVDHFRASDITFWGVFALVAWAIAMLSANLSASIPDSVLGGLHASRLAGASLNQLRADIAGLQGETVRLRQENAVLLQRFLLGEQAGTQVTQRVGALEQTVPRMVEALAAQAPGIDPTTTASTGAGASTIFDAEGGSVSYRTGPLMPGAQPMPDAIVAGVPDTGAYGIALGRPIDTGEGVQTWRDMNAKVGPLLLGLAPLLANVEGTAGKRLVAGPISNEAEARQLCGRMAKVGIACASVPYIGEPLPQLE